MKTKQGLTLVELVVTIAIISILTALVLVNYRTFTTRSSLVARLSQLEEFIQFAQERSASAEEFVNPDDEKDITQNGYQVIHLKVEEGTLRSFTHRKKAEYEGESATTITDLGELIKTDIKNNAATVEIPQSENYFVDACFIHMKDETDKYTRTTLEFATGDRDACTKRTNHPILCSEPDPDYNAEKVEHNTFDIFLLLEQPTREIRSIVYPTEFSPNPELKALPFGDNSSSGNSFGTEDYKGIRIVFITPAGIKRSLDVYRLGLVTTKSKDTGNGCVNVPPSSEGQGTTPSQDGDGTEEE